MSASSAIRLIVSAIVRVAGGRPRDVRTSSRLRSSARLRIAFKRVERSDARGRAMLNRKAERRGCLSEI